MRIALISDIHANASALEAVLTDARSHGIDALWNLGDTVGYGPDPDEVVAVLEAAEARSVAGNHDAAAIGAIGFESFNPIAASAARWTADTISLQTASYLRSLPLVDSDDTVTLCHGTLRDPTWEYLNTFDAAAAHFALQRTWLSMVGHTHRPALIAIDASAAISSRQPPLGEPYPLDRESRWCINPGSVGQPRDGDRRSSYALLDLAAGTIIYWRIPYDIHAVQQRTRDRGLPEPLAARLALGR